MDFKLRSTYNFDVYPAALFGQTHREMTVVSIMDHTSAVREADVQALHAQIYSTLPAGTKNDYTSYDYVKFKTSTGQYVVLGLAWIKEETIQLVESTTLTIKVTGVTAADAPRIVQLLAQAGYRSASVTAVSAVS